MNLAGPLDPHILKQSFNEIIRRHEILRATIEEIDGQPVQVISPSLTVDVAITDLRQVPGERRESELQQLSVEEARRPFALERGPLIRIGLVRMEDQRHVLTLTIHQIICDGWSIGLIMEELQKIYAAYTQGLANPLPPLAIQFADYIVWKQELANRSELQSQLSYWKRKLSRYHRLEIAPDLPSPLRESPDAVIISHLLPRSLTERLRDLSNAQGGTFFITSLAAFFAFLHRLTGQSDLAVGSPLAGRGRTDLEGLIGQFVNHIVYRTEIDGDPTFEDFLLSVRDTIWETFSNQDVPFESVVKALSPGTDTFRDPFFLVNFICQKEYGRASTFNFDFSGIRMSTMPSESQGALYDLNFFLVEREVGWRLSLEYKSHLYSKETAKSLLDSFKGILEAVAESPRQKLSELAILDFPEYLAKIAHAAPVGPELYAMPASLIQQRYWYLTNLAAGKGSFSMPACIRISGPLSHEALERSFTYLCERHEPLRTTFEQNREEIVQIISPPQRFTLPVSDLSDVPAAQRESRLLRLVSMEPSLPFDLQKGPLLRTRLYRLADQEHVLLTVIHHVISDGWSNGILQNELWKSYAAFCAGQSPQLPRLTLQYSDFSAWQSEWLASPAAQEHVDFWLKQLSGDLPVLDFPTDRPPTNTPATQGAIETHLLSVDFARNLKAFAQSHGVTTFVLMLTAFAILLARRSRRYDMILGSPVANRRQETEPLIGPFSGPICLRLNLSGNPTLLQILEHVRDVTLEALSHTDLPFEAILDHIRPKTVHNRKPLFQFYFFFQTAFLQGREVAGLTITPMSTITSGIPFELQLGMIERPEGIRVQLEYNPDLFDATTVREIIRDFESTLNMILSASAQRVEDIVI